MVWVYSGYVCTCVCVRFRVTIVCNGQRENNKTNHPHAYYIGSRQIPQTTRSLIVTSNANSTPFMVTDWYVMPRLSTHAPVSGTS